MHYGLELSSNQSYYLYFVAIFSAAFFAHLSDKFSKKSKKGENVVNPIFWSISFAFLFLPLAFRGYGVDYDSYNQIYQEIKSLGADYILKYDGMPEFLFALLNYLVANTIDKFQFVLISSSFLTIYLMFKSFSRLIKRANLGILVWSFGFTYYLLIFGLVRLSIALSITAYSLKYLEIRNYTKYFFSVFLAMLFHYSAAIMIPVYFLVWYKNDLSFKENKSNNLIFVINLIFILLLSLFAASKLLPMFFGGFEWFSRYNLYFVISSDFNVLKNIFSFLPLIVIIVLFSNEMIAQFLYGNIYIRLFLILLFIALISVFFPIHRFTYYFYSAGWYLYAIVPKIKLKKNEMKFFSPVYIYSLVLFGAVWINYAIFNSLLWGPYLIPYYFKIFN